MIIIKRTFQCLRFCLETVPTPIIPQVCAFFGGVNFQSCWVLLNKIPIHKVILINSWPSQKELPLFQEFSKVKEISFKGTVITLWSCSGSKDISRCLLKYMKPICFQDVADHKISACMNIKAGLNLPQVMLLIKFEINIKYWKCFWYKFCIASKGQHVSSLEYYRYDYSLWITTANK